MTNSPDSDKRYDNKYRLSDKTLKTWNRIIFSIMGVGLAGFAVLIGISAVKYSEASIDEVPVIIINLFWVFGFISFGIPLILGAIVGGLAIHRYAWIPLLLAMLGLLAEGVSRLDGYGFLALWGWIAIGVGVVGTFLIAIFRTQVDIWLALPVLNSPRWYLRGKRRNEDDQDGTIDQDPPYDQNKK